MQAAVLAGEDARLDVIDIPIPHPREGEVLIKVAACGVCHTDLHVMRSEVAFPRPAVLGHEVSGTVVELGPDTTGVDVGDRVVCSFMMPCGTCRHCAAGHDDLCSTFFEMNRLRGTLYDGTTRLTSNDGDPIWMYSMGGLAEYCVVPATDVFRVPDEIGLEDVAIVGCSAFTAFGAVKNVAAVGLGETVAVIATGGVGLSIIQFARAAGAVRIIAVDVDDAKLAAARAAGATDVVDSTTVADPAAEIVRLTGGRGVDVAFEALGRAQTFATCVNSIADGGRAVLVGIAPAGVKGELDLARVVRRKIQILGSYGARARTDMPLLLDLVRRGVVDPKALISARYAPERVDDAYQALAQGKIVGRAIVQFA